MWLKVILTNVFLFCSLPLLAAALPAQFQTTLHYSITVEEKPSSLTIRDFFRLPDSLRRTVFCTHSRSHGEPGQPASTPMMQSTGYEGRKRPQVFTAQASIPRAKSDKASTHQAGRKISNRYTRTGILIVKAMLYSAILCCVVEITITFMRWLCASVPAANTHTTSEQYYDHGSFREEDDDDEANIPVL